MSKEAVREALSIPESQRSVISAFTSQSYRQVAQGQIRATLGELGYHDRRVSLGDPSLIARADEHGAKVAASIIQTFNAMLAGKIDALPDGLTDAQMRAALEPFQKSLFDYNRTVLVPFTSATAQQDAIKTFYRQNGIASQWQVEPQETAGLDDDCDDALDASPCSLDESEQWSMPAHPRCPHAWVAAGVNDSTLPAESDLWDGSGDTAKSAKIRPRLHCKSADDNTYTLALDLDCTALQFPDQLVPLALAITDAGGRVGVLTGNDTPAARQMWDDLGYPAPAFYQIHHHSDPDKIGTWKAKQAKKLDVDLLIDDFVQGDAAEAYQERAGKHIGLQVLLPPGTPKQNVKSLEQL